MQLRGVRNNSTGIATWHTRTADFWADFEQHYQRRNKRVPKRLWACIETEFRTIVDTAHNTIFVQKS